MEKRGIRTERGDLNREIEVTNQKLRQLKARISKLQKWLKEEQENTEPPTLAGYIQGILSRRAREGKSQYSQSLYNLKDAAKMLNFLQANNIMDTAAHDYLKGVMNDKTALPVKAWKAEYAKLTAERKNLNQRYLALKEEVREAEQIRKSIYSILRQEQREQQPRRAQDMER